MKKLLTLLAVLGAFCAEAQLNQVVIEPYTFTNPLSAQPPGTTTYRVYAEMGSATDIVTAVFAIEDCHPLDVSTTTEFYNDNFGGINPTGINPAFYVVFPFIEADSWVTIGVDDTIDPGAADIGQASTIPADPFTSSMNTPSGGNLIMDDGAWFALQTSPAALPSGPLNRVLLGQFTTDGALSFNLNLQAFLGGDLVNGRVDYVHSFPCDDGGVLTGFEQVEPSLSQVYGVLACGDPEACNYNEGDDNSNCCYDCTCTDPNATNYGGDVGCDNISVCTYSVSGSLYEFVQDVPLGNQEVMLSPLGLTTTTDVNGEFEFNDLPYGFYEIEFTNSFIEEGFLSDISSSLTVLLNNNYELQYFCELDPGCDDPEACNYVAGSANDLWCCYNCICTDPLASNYGGNEGCDNPSVCNYDLQANFLNINDLQGIEGLSVTLEPLGIQASSDASGAVTFENIPYGLYNLDVQPAPVMQYFAIGESSPLQFVVSNNTLDGLNYYFDFQFGCANPLACNYQEGNIVDDGSCSFDCGCLDQNACNYAEDPETIVDCIYPSCTNPLACNYDSNGLCYNDEFCDFTGQLYVQVFQDIDNDGAFDGGFDEGGWFWSLEPTLINVQVTIEELGWQGFTNEDGYIQFTDLPYGTYTITVHPDPGWETDTYSYTVNISDCTENEIFFALDWQGDESFWFNGPCCIWLFDIHCDDGFDPGIWVMNSGGVPLNGVVTASFSPLLQAVPMGGNAVAPTTINPGEVIWEFNNQQPGQDELYQCHIIGPGVDYIGVTFPIDLNIVLFNDEGIEYYNNTWTLYPEVVCAYDPNDKYTEFEGYTEEHHFILPEDEMEYRIRFQNTGNFPAGDVIIRDTLDIEHLDLDTFYPAFGSHDFTTCIKPDGAIEFNFADIQLPDSTCCEEESHGYVVYRIKPREDVEPGDVINNTAYIFFDGNPPIVTNTTWHTIYECTDELAAYELASDTQCEDQLIQFNSTGQYIEDYYWSQDGQTNGVESTYFIMPEEPGDINIGLIAVNPLCEAEYSSVITIHPRPAVDAGLDQTVCPEEPVTFLATGDGDLQWDDQDMGASLDIIASAESEYSVAATSEFGCVATDQVSLFLHPEPVASFMANGNLLTYDGDAGINYQWYLNNEMIDGATSATYEVLEDGNYAVEVTNEFGCNDISDEDFIVYSGIEESYLWNIQVYPNPNDGLLHISMEQQGRFNLQIIDNSGKLVHQEAFQTTKLDVNTSKLARGLYTLRICHEDGSVCLNRRITKR